MNLQCEECGTKYILSAVNNSLMQLGRGDYDVEWFRCPGCGKVYIVGIKDLKYYDLKAALDKAKSKVRKAIEDGDSELATKFLKIAQMRASSVSRHLERTMGKFHGTFTVLPSVEEQPELVYLP